MEKIIAGLVQMDSGPDMNENMRMAEQYVREAAEQGAKLILFPETAEYTGADMPGHASAVPGYVSRRFSSLAKRYGVYLHCGSMTVRRHPGRPSNTSFLFGPDGETIAEYSKIHMFDVNIPGSVSYEESHEICPGNEIVLADTALGLFGMSICYDIYFPEILHIPSLRKADVNICVSAAAKPSAPFFEKILPARALENVTYLAFVNNVGPMAGLDMAGESRALSPLGDEIVRCGDSEEIVRFTADTEELTRARSVRRHLSDFRRDIDWNPV